MKNSGIIETNSYYKELLASRVSVLPTNAVIVASTKKPEYQEVYYLKSDDECGVYELWAAPMFRELKRKYFLLARSKGKIMSNVKAAKTLIYALWKNRGSSLASPVSIETKQGVLVDDEVDKLNYVLNRLGSKSKCNTYAMLRRRCCHGESVQSHEFARA